jgi:EAL domain-containing protein (putative c-di-GMP-specific phosphodiesterase class I)/CHASE2 domain-containing sensor protein
VPWRKKQKPDRSPSRLLLWIAVAGLIFGLIGFGELPEDVLRAGRNSLHIHKASGDIVLVKIDEQSVRSVGRWPWPRRTHAELTDALTDAGPKQILYDVTFDTLSDAQEDRLFAESLKRSGRVTLPARVRLGLYGGANQELLAHPMFSPYVELGTVSVPYNYQNAVWRIPYAAQLGDRSIPSFAAKLAGKSAPAGAVFTPDYSVDPASIPSISAVDVLAGRYDPKLFAGKAVIVGATSDQIGDQYFIPGHGRLGGAYVQIIGAETLKAGTPVHIHWFVAYLTALALTALALRGSKLRQILLIGIGAAVLLLGPALLEACLVTIDVTPGLFVLGIIATLLAVRHFRSRGFVNAVSGLPNLSAFRAEASGREQALIAARIINYAEIAASLPADSERQLIDQIVGRLRVGQPDRRLFQGDGGIFAWFEEPRLPFGNHLDALYALFRNPARVGGQQIDLSVSFGVEVGSSRSLGNRLASALVAGEEAAHDGLKWKVHDPQTLQDSSWKLSMLSQLDAAVDKGEVWVAFQPKLDLATQRIVGAEALARWTHPEKGPIAASEFIAAAEQNDRIGKLTDFVLEQAIAAAATLGDYQRDFGMAVNLSARLLSDQGFVLRLTTMLSRYRVDPSRLTLELTETAALAGSGTAIEMLGAIRRLGVSVSIDDYGTGLSTLEYLRKIPANEIKIDQSFIKGMFDNRSDRLMVQSTIGLAHSLGRKVVAEGIERREILDTLIEMGCDIGQGYIIGRPMSLESLAKRLPVADRNRVA